MRGLIIFYFCLFISAFAISQDITGEWQGYYTYDWKISGYAQEVPIALSIEMNPDSSFVIFSLTKLKNIERKDTIQICRIKYKKTSKKLYVFEEQKYSEDEIDNQNFQKMYLYFQERKGVKTLNGRWKMVNSDDPAEGDIFFKKIN